MKKFLQNLVFIISWMVCSAKYGIDLSFYFTSSQIIQSFPSSNTNISNSFAIVQLMFYNGSLNPPGAQSLRAAWSAGIKDLSIYIYPCMMGSPYSISFAPNGTTDYCPPIEDQFNTLINYLEFQDISFQQRNYSYLNRNYSYSENDALNSAFYENHHSNVNHLNNSRIYLQTLYLNIEDETPNYYFTINSTYNMEFITRAVDFLVSRGIEVGFYTTKVDWYNTMTSIINYHGENNQTTGYFYSGFRSSLYNHLTDIHLSPVTNPFQKLKLWTPRYDSLYSMSFYSSFGDWETPYVKQLTGSTTDLRRIGTSRICMDYIAD